MNFFSFILLLILGLGSSYLTYVYFGSDYDSRGGSGINVGHFQKHLDTVENVNFEEITNPNRVFSSNELARYNGENGGPIYLSILGEVFDVSKGRRHYQIGGAYANLAARDASLAFITGNFQDDLTDDITSLDVNQMHALKDWKDFYLKDYRKVGVLNGRFYDENGLPRDDFLEQKMFQVSQHEASEQAEKVRYPPCNSRWNGEKEEGKVWCTARSGGIARNWVGVPRRRHRPGKSQASCVCANENDANSDANLAIYEGCSPDSFECRTYKGQDAVRVGSNIKQEEKENQEENLLLNEDEKNNQLLSNEELTEKVRQFEQNVKIINTNEPELQIE